MKAQDIEIEADLMACPVCYMQIRAKVTIRPEFGEPTLNLAKGGSVNLPMSPQMVRFNVNHTCTGPVDVAVTR